MRLSPSAKREGLRRTQSGKYSVIGVIASSGRWKSTAVNERLQRSSSGPTAVKRVLGVGNCSFDHGNIERLIATNFDAEVVPASLQDEALEMLRAAAFDLVLVNRRFAYDAASSGVELIGQIKADPRLADTPVMLLSNYPEAQQAAVDAGAEPGFGKAELDRPETVEKLARFLDTRALN